MPGTGKTSVGRKLAETLGVSFADSDELIVRREGRPVAEIFAQEGEQYFRQVEAEVIAEALTNFDGVLALGGGAVTNAASREALTASKAPVVHLQTGISTLTSRVGSAHDRPLLASDPASRLTELAGQRGEWYRAVATVTVDTERRGVGRVVEVIARLIDDAADEASEQTSEDQANLVNEDATEGTQQS